MDDEKVVIVYRIVDEDGACWCARVFDNRPQADAWIDDVRYDSNIYPHSFFLSSWARPLYYGKVQERFL